MADQRLIGQYHLTMAANLCDPDIDLGLEQRKELAEIDIVGMMRISEKLSLERTPWLECLTEASILKNIAYV